jgi:hypothetical protein
MLKLEEQRLVKENNQAKLLYDKTIKDNNDRLTLKRDEIYKRSPVILIHRITPGSLNETDLLAIHHLNKEERKDKRKTLVNEFRLDLLKKYKAGSLQEEELIKLVK